MIKTTIKSILAGAAICLGVASVVVYRHYSLKQLERYDQLVQGRSQMELVALRTKRAQRAEAKRQEWVEFIDSLNKKAAHDIGPPPSKTTFDQRVRLIVESGLLDPRKGLMLIGAETMKIVGPDGTFPVLPVTIDPEGKEWFCTGIKAETHLSVSKDRDDQAKALAAIRSRVPLPADMSVSLFQRRLEPLEEYRELEVLSAQNHAR